jgi:hypothetical protein
MGLLALSIILLGGGGFAAQSALAITSSAGADIAAQTAASRATSGEYGPLPFASGRDAPLRLALH